MTTLRSRIIISTMFIIFLIIAGSYLVIQDIQRGIIEGDFRDKGFLLAKDLAQDVTNPLLLNDLVSIRDSFDNVKKNYPDVEYIYLTDSEGIVLVHTFDKGFPKALQNMTKPSNTVKESVIDTESGIIHEFNAPVFSNIGYIHVGLTENGIRAQILEASRRLLLLAISALFIGGVFSYLTGKRLAGPVSKLTEGANRINKGILDQKIDIITDDELGELGRTFNDMALNLDQKIKDIIASKEQIEAAEKYLETLFDSIDDGIFVVNSDHEIVKVNKSFLKLMGLNEEHVTGRTCHEIVFGDKAQNKTEECPVEKLLQTKKPLRFMHEININGAKKILEINASPFLDKKDITNIIFVMRDITQQKALEEEIISRNRELTILNKISRNISETFDLDKILLNTLDKLLEFTGMECGEVYLLDENTGEFVLKNYPGSEENRSNGALNAMVKGNEVIVMEDKRNLSGMAFEDKSGCISFARIPLKSKDKVLGIITIRSKVSHRFSARDKELFMAIGSQIGVAIENILFYNNIIYLKEFNEEILNNINQAIHVVDKNMKILAINDELQKLGRGRFKKHQIINKNLFEAFPFLKEKNLDMEYEHVIKTGEIFLSEEKTEYFDEVIYTNTSKIPIKDKNGNVEKIITVITDVTEHKKLEEELKDSYEELKLTYSKLQELFRMKDNFLSNISHELRTPLTSVIGYTELMLEGNLTEEQRHKAEIILRNSKRLSKLIRALLDTPLIESGNLQLKTQLVPLFDLAAQVIEDMKTIASIKNIPIFNDISESIIINGDKERLLQVFSNILDNAIKFTIKGGIRISAEEEAENIHIKIIDTGIGIPQENLLRIFDKFYQVESSSTRKYEGAGLGLWISKNIVEAHGGKIWAESKNRGSTFHILLPKSVKE
ncbi:Methyl sulfide methyltransferase-associated sensor [uncultured archaeon]|nr:Methyl sulfide methyltransferase-associated sensor [uncultured archaeon]